MVLLKIITMANYSYASLLNIYENSKRKTKNHNFVRSKPSTDINV